MNGTPRCPGKWTRGPSAVHWTLEWIPRVGSVQHHGTDAEGEQEEYQVSEVTTESIEESGEPFDDGHAMGEVFRPDEGVGGGQDTQAADNPPLTMNEDAGDPSGPRSTTSASRPAPVTGAGSTLSPQPAPPTTTMTVGLPMPSSPSMINPLDPTTNVDTPNAPPGANPLLTHLHQGNGREAMSGDQPGQVHYWKQTGGEYVAPVIPSPGVGWPQAIQPPVLSQVMGSTAQLVDYSNGAPVTIPTHSYYAAMCSGHT
ncbi:unnamed protein product [Phytophthora fragariaefolia]|uniref:Unnamed protein product n=1 Tax=Phytophthora fragariaefolia TaxID=1490495 RepID=A0A9W6U0F5_9STRA|nr:unnamed protein product [Phytophthora fragariaefolia]